MRIIAGEAKGRKFSAPEGRDTRPTLDRVKESMFGMIQFDLPGAVVLDLFSGSGNLGLEAVSRGAAHAYLNDRSAVCCRIIRSNAGALGFSGRVTVTRMDYAERIRTLGEAGVSVQIVLIDAPYADGTAAKAAEQVFRNGILAPGGRVLVEHAADQPPAVPEDCCRVLSTRHFGICAITEYGRTEQREQ